MVAEEFLIRLNAHVGQNAAAGRQRLQDCGGAEAGAGPDVRGRGWGRG